MDGGAELQEILRELDSDDPRARVLMLQALIGAPTGSDLVRHRLRALLDDRTPTTVAIPYTFGEVRWVAAHALAAEQRARRDEQPVVLTDVTVPVGIDTLAALADEAQVDYRGGLDGMAAAFAALRDRGRLALTTLRL